MCIERKPWGWYWLIANTTRWWLKLIVVHGRTSNQKHSHRTELILGTRGYKKIRPEEYHRLTTGVYLEFAYGYPVESDIVRIEDDYNRV